MPLQLENAAPIPNALMVPAITIYTQCVNGVLVTAAHIVLRAAVVDPVTGLWTPVGEEKTTQIDNVEQLPEDLATATIKINGEDVSIAALVGQAMGNVITLVGALNSIRKIL